jgi:uncharacterized protein (TIGR02145 family)
LGAYCSNTGIVWVPCGSGQYNYSTEFCSGNNIQALCNGEEYDSDNEFCYKNGDGTHEIKEKCGGKTYVYPQICQGATIKGICGADGMPYNIDEYFCVSDELYSTATHFCDYRDNTAYKWVKIGEQTWMAENLNFIPTDNTVATNSKCYDDKLENCEKYGRLYGWATAMATISSYNSSLYTAAPEHQGICPNGWHVPDSAEVKILFVAAGGSGTNNLTGAATKLKTLSDSFSGTNESGFDALPGGHYVYSGSKYQDLGNDAYFWTSHQINSHNTYIYHFSSLANAYFSSHSKTSYLNSLRCIKNEEADD